jgi:hypothetical protein
MCGVCYREARRIEDRNTIRAFIVLTAIVLATIVVSVIRSVFQ